MSTRIDIGDGHSIRPYVGSDSDAVIGFIVEHPRPDNGEPCEGSVLFDTADQRYRTKRADGALSHVWTVLQGEPNWTLSPSLACGSCSDHGWIRDGRWVRA